MGQRGRACHGWDRSIVGLAVLAADDENGKGNGKGSLPSIVFDLLHTSMSCVLMYSRSLFEYYCLYFGPAGFALIYLLPYT